MVIFLGMVQMALGITHITQVAWSLRTIIGSDESRLPWRHFFAWLSSFIIPRIGSKENLD